MARKGKQMDKIHTNICKICGKEFTTIHKQQRICSDECRKEIEIRRTRERKAYKTGIDRNSSKERKAKAKANKKALIDTAKKAKQAGMTYGQYVAQQYMNRGE